MPEDASTAGGSAPGTPSEPEPTARRRDRPLVQRAIVSDALMDPEERERIGFDPSPDAPIPVVVELNLRHHEGLEGAAGRFVDHYHQTLPGRPEPERVADTYYRCLLTQADILRLVEADQREPDPSRRIIYRVWPDFPVHPLIDGSCATVKADAARRSFDATGRGITWAVLDSGIDADHHHFRRYQTLTGDVASLHRDFTRPGEPSLGDALVDRFGHGTHVAGIIAGGLPARMPRGRDLRVVERVFDPAARTPRACRSARSAGPSCWPAWPRRPSWSASRCSTTGATASP
jgi:serine protease AprX